LAPILHNAFIVFDVDTDGYISQDDLERIFESDPETLKRRIAEGTAGNGNRANSGSVSTRGANLSRLGRQTSKERKSSVSSPSKRGKHNHSRTSNTSPKSADANPNNDSPNSTSTVASFAEYFDEKFRLPDKWIVEDILRRMDLDRDGKISLKDFKRYVLAAVQ
jgi:hypothetical protein